MAPTPQAKDEHGLHRVLGTWDLVLLNVAAIVALRWLSTAAQIGPSSLVLWVLGLVCFFIPLAFAVLELSSRLPGEGGFYLWSKHAFGDLHGFIAGWTYWVSNLVFLPSALLFSAGIFLHIGGEPTAVSIGDPIYNGCYCMIVLWLATGLNIFGLDRAKWLQNLGGIATWLAAALLLAAGAIAWYRFGAATPIALADLRPDFSALSTFSTFATIALAYVGLELGPILGGEMKDPRRQIPRATLIAGFIVAAIYISGTASLLIALPTASIDLIGGIPQALSAVGDRIGLPGFGRFTAGLVALGSIGSICAWVTCTARLPFMVGVDRYLPRAMARLHPRYDTPYVALTAQGIVTSLILLTALSGSSIHEAFVILLDVTVILSLLPLLYIFAAFVLLRRRAAGHSEGVALAPGGDGVAFCAGALGIATTSLAIVTSAIPPEGTMHGALFVLKVIGGSALLIGIGLMFYRNGQRKLAVA